MEVGGGGDPEEEGDWLRLALGKGVGCPKWKEEGFKKVGVRVRGC